MCGRYQEAEEAEALSQRLQAHNKAGNWTPRWNIRPTDQAPVAIEDEDRRLGLMRWGWQREWAKGPIINARCDKITTSKMWHQALLKQRCVVPATGWWEWRGSAGRKTPYCHRLRSDEPFTLAGFWSREGDEGRFVVLVTDASKIISHVHDRMPVLLIGDEVDQWLDPAAEEDELLGLCGPALDELVQCYPVKPFKTLDDGERLVITQERGRHE